MFPLTRALTGAFLLSSTATAPAAILLVTTSADSFDGVCNLQCSLRDAVAAANQAPNADTIVLPLGTYVLNRPVPLDANGLPVDDDDHQFGDLDVRGELRIRGLDTAKTIIQGQFNDRLFEVRPGASLRLDKLTLEKGSTVHNGGAVANHGQLTLNEVLVRHNQALYPQTAVSPTKTYATAQGGGIANYGELTLLSSRLQYNTATGHQMNTHTGRGGGLFNHLGTVVMRDSIFLANSALDHGDSGDGGALYNLQGSVTVERSAFLLHGGAEFSDAALFNDEGELRLSNSTLSQNHLGGLVNIRRQPGAMAQVTLTNVTITGHFGEDRYAVANGGDLLIHNSIIAGNYDFSIKEAPSNCINFGDYSYQASGLLIGDEPSNCTGDYFVSFDDTYSQVLVPTLSKPDETHWFHALRPGSVAIDAGIGDCIDHDQRGVARPQDGDGDGVAVCDLGAYELTVP
jgi:CSLREA domain-containing protein